MYLGAYIRDDAYRPENITAFESDIHKDLAIINIFTSFDYDWHALRVQNTNIVAQGATPMITLEPTLSNRSNDNLLPEIIAGDWDGYLEQWIDDFKTWIEDRDDPHARILLRFAHEFNGIWYPWSNDPENYIIAWRKLHAKFEAADANQYVEWVWSVNNVDVDVDDYNDITLYYPGEDVVDWTAIDGYNWGANYAFSQWSTFAELFEEKYDLLMLHYPKHPILITEVASAEPSDFPDLSLGQDGDDSAESKGQWIADMFKQLRLNFRGIKGVVWFNMNKELSWSINEALHNTGVAKFKQMAQKKDITSEFNSADSYKFDGTLTGKGNRVQSQADGFRQLPKTSIEQRRKKHHGMIADKAQK